MKRKLTPKLKQFLFQNRFKVKKSDYAGEALDYLNKLRAASKAAKKRKENTLILNGVKIPRNSELYSTIEAAAKIKKQSVSTFVKKNKKAIELLMEDGSVVISRETEYAIRDIQKLPKKTKIFIGERNVSKEEAIFALQDIQSNSMRISNIVVINYELKYDLLGNLHLDIPLPEDYEDLLDDIDELREDDQDEQGGDEWESFLEQYAPVTFIKS